MLETFVLPAIGFGFAAGTALGPFTMYIISTTLAYGWRKGILVIFSPLLVDIPIIITMTFILGQLPDWGVRLIQIVGGAYTLWLAWSTWKSLQKGVQFDTDMQVPANTRDLMLRGFLMNALSPGPYIFWGTITGPLLRQALDLSLTHAAALMLAFYITFLTFLAMWVVVFDRLRRVDQRFTRLMLTLSVIVLAILGIWLILGGIFS
ncbi:MAG: LysE family transporter [Anaerolineae bacterium]|jgi:threonine/homoserine/homoserine lactone efflux protein|nr:LysE family transporter [Anaerolineae bacterium]